MCYRNSVHHMTLRTNEFPLFEAERNGRVWLGAGSDPHLAGVGQQGKRLAGSLKISIPRAKRGAQRQDDVTQQHKRNQNHLRNTHRPKSQALKAALMIRVLGHLALR